MIWSAGTTETLKLAGIALVGVAIFAGALASATNAASLLSRGWTEYTSWLERSLRAMFVFVSGRRIAFAQIGALVVILGASIGTGMPRLCFLLPAVAVAPWLAIRRMQAKRTQKAEAQLPSFLQVLSNSLRARPSIGAALDAITPVLERPFRDEVELALKQMKLGSPLDQALIAIAVRLRSSGIDVAVSAILVGREVGGNISKTLDATAASLRELFRLDAVLRSKTAEGRNQLLILTISPIAVFVGFEQASPGYFMPLLNHPQGWLFLTIAGLMWLGALVWARKIMAVDL